MSEVKKKGKAAKELRFGLCSFGLWALLFRRQEPEPKAKAAKATKSKAGRTPLRDSRDCGDCGVCLFDSRHPECHET